MTEFEHDVVLRENRRAELARRLLSHGVRTDIITRLTDLTRNRLSTVRRRLGVVNNQRARGPSRSSLKVLLRTPRARAEGAAIATLCELFDVPILIDRPPLPKIVSLTFGEKLCDVYEAFCVVNPGTNLDFEHLLLIRRGLSAHPSDASVYLGKCRTCKCLVLEEIYRVSDCWHCGAHPSRTERESRPRTARHRKRSLRTSQA
jgi:hypothetical protein